MAVRSILTTWCVQYQIANLPQWPLVAKQEMKLNVTAVPYTK